MKINLDNYSFEYGKAVSKPTATENGRSFSLINESGCVVKKWAIDKVVFKDRNEERCDYLLLVERKDDNIYYWVELKGSDIIKACRQIWNTLNIIDVNEGRKQEGRIITTRTPAPALRDAVYIKLNRHIRVLGGHLKIYTNQGTETI